MEYQEAQKQQPDWAQRLDEAVQERAPSEKPSLVAGIKEMPQTRKGRIRLAIASVVLAAIGLAAFLLLSGTGSDLYDSLTGAAVYVEPSEVQLHAGLEVSQAVEPGSVPAGGALTYTVRVTNTGQVTLTATIVDILPDHVEPAGALIWEATLSPTTTSTTASVWTQRFSVTTGLDYAGVLTNVVWVTSLQGATGACTQTAELQITPRLEVNQHVSPELVQAGAPLVYSLQVTNTGNVDLQATISDMLPAHVQPGGTLVWTPVIPHGTGREVWSHQVVVTADVGYAGPLTNLVEVTSAEGATGSSSQTSGAQVTTDLLMVMEAAPNPVRAGGAVTYTLHVTNTGNGDLRASVNHQLPPQVSGQGLDWSPLVIEAGGAWSQTTVGTVAEGYAGLLTSVFHVATEEGVMEACTETVQSLVPGLLVAQQASHGQVKARQPLTYTLRVTNTGNTVLHATIMDTPPDHTTPKQGLLWWAATLPPGGGTWTREVVVTPEEGYSGPLPNVLQVTTAEGPTGGYTETCLCLSSQLALDAEARPDPVQAGQLMTYTLQVTNTGNTALHATISNRLPKQVTPTGTLSWPPMVLAPGGTWKQTVAVSVELDYTGPLTNVLWVTTAEGVTGAFTQTTASHASDLALYQRVEPHQVVAGSLLTYTLYVTNTGNVDLQAIIVDRLPARVTTPSDVLWWMATITAPGGVWVRTASVTVELGYSGLLTNVLEVHTFEGASGVYTKTTACLAPVGGLTVTADSHTFLPHTTKLTAVITAGHDVAYTWNFGDGSPLRTTHGTLTNTAVVNHTYALAGNHTATVTASNSLGWMTATTTVQIYDPGLLTHLPLVMRSLP